MSLQLIIRDRGMQDAAEITERLMRASGKRGVDQDARVNEFKREVLGRASDLIGEMGQTFDVFLRRVVDQLAQFKCEYLLIGWSGIRFAETKWLLDGQLQITFSVDRPMPPDPELFHEVVDPYVDDVVGDFDLPADFKAELAGFLKGLMLQFAVIRKHEPQLDLRWIAFEDYRWVEANVLRCYITHRGRRLVPRDIGWD